MVKEELERQIRSCEDEIVVLRAEIARLDEDRLEYEKLKARLCEQLQSLKDRQQMRRVKVSTISEISGLPKLSRTVSSRLASSLEGPSFNRASSGLSEARDRVSSELGLVGDKVREKSERILQLKARIENLRVQLAKLAQADVRGAS